MLSGSDTKGLHSFNQDGGQMFLSLVIKNILSDLKITLSHTEERQIWTLCKGLQIKLFDTNEATDCTYLSPDRGKMERKNKASKNKSSWEKAQYKS